MKRDIIRLSEIKLHAAHGCYENEKVHPQHFVVNIVCETQKLLDDSDELHRTINYENLRAIAFRVFEQSPVNLIETLANQIASHVLKLDGVFSVEVRIRKPDIWKDATPEVEIYRQN